MWIRFENIWQYLTIFDNLTIYYKITILTFDNMTMEIWQFDTMTIEIWQYDNMTMLKYDNIAIFDPIWQWQNDNLRICEYNCMRRWDENMFKRTFQALLLSLHYGLSQPVIGDYWSFIIFFMTIFIRNIMIWKIIPFFIMIIMIIAIIIIVINMWIKAEKEREKMSIVLRLRWSTLVSMPQ